MRSMLCALFVSIMHQRVLLLMFACLICHCALYIKLMKWNIPLELLNVLINWYSRCDAFVNWNGFFARVFRTLGGVRQGGVLSPLLFAVYVDDIIGQLKDSG